MSNKLADAFIAIRDHNWQLVAAGNKKILVPPITDERRMWTAMWDENGYLIGCLSFLRVKSNLLKF